MSRDRYNGHSIDEFIHTLSNRMAEVGEQLKIVLLSPPVFDVLERFMHDRMRTRYSPSSIIHGRVEYITGHGRFVIKAQKIFENDDGVTWETDRGFGASSVHKIIEFPREMARPWMAEESVESVTYDPPEYKLKHETNPIVPKNFIEQLKEV